MRRNAMQVAGAGAAGRLDAKGFARVGAGARSALALVLSLSLSAAPAAADERDAEGTKDHPAVKRYPGSFITEQVAKEFEAFAVPVGAGKVEKVEGRLHWASYTYPSDATCTQIIRNYEKAFRGAGMTVHAGGTPPPEAGPLELFGNAFVTGIGASKGGGRLYVVQTCGEAGETYGNLVVVEVASMAQKVEVSAEGMADELEKSGRVALYGIRFATGKADIEPESASVLEQVARLLEAKPEWRLRVAGHTDDVGKPKENLALSRRRAEAVKEWLVSRHGVAPARLAPEGFGDTKPLADNATEDGRARNRRVELTKQ